MDCLICLITVPNQIKNIHYDFWWCVKGEGVGVGSSFAFRETISMGGLPGGTEGRKNYVFNLLTIIITKSNYSNMMGHQACNYMNYVHGTKGKMNREDRKKNYLTHFSLVSHLYISLKTSENQRFCSFLFRGYRNVTLD